jgi:hypothetical protein
LNCPSTGLRGQPCDQIEGRGQVARLHQSYQKRTGKPEVPTFRRAYPSPDGHRAVDVAGGSECATDCGLEGLLHRHHWNLIVDPVRTIDGSGEGFGEHRVAKRAGGFAEVVACLDGGSVASCKSGIEGGDCLRENLSRTSACSGGCENARSFGPHGKRVGGVRFGSPGNKMRLGRWMNLREQCRIHFAEWRMPLDELEQSECIQSSRRDGPRFEVAEREV